MTETTDAGYVLSPGCRATVFADDGDRFALRVDPSMLPIFVITTKRLTADGKFIAEMRIRPATAEEARAHDEHRSVMMDGVKKAIEHGF